jgi:hypothetical protein
MMMKEQEGKQDIGHKKIAEYYDSLNSQDRIMLKQIMAGKLKTEDYSPAWFARVERIMNNISPESKKEKQTDDQRIIMYRDYGLEVGVPAGRCGFSENMMCAPHDGVPYCMDDHGDFFDNKKESSLKHGIYHRQLLIRRNHEVIKKVYDYCTTLEKGDIWVLSGGGTQLQAFFGCSSGYLAVLYLGMEDAKDHTAAQIERISNRTSILQPQFEHNELLFSDLKISGVKVKHFPGSEFTP